MDPLANGNGSNEHIRTRAHTPNTDNALDIRLARLFTFFVGLLGIILPLTFWSLITMSTKKAICSSLENLTTLAAELFNVFLYHYLTQVSRRRCSCL